MTESPSLRTLLEETGALRTGHFLLSSGLHSPSYVQCALLLQHPAHAQRFGAELGERLAAHRPASVLGLALGGVIIGHEVAAALGVPFRFCERAGEGMELRRGFALAPGEPVVVVEDVVTTGRSTGEAMRLALEAGAEVRAVGALIDRSEGRPFAVPFQSLLRLELETWSPDACPWCRAGGRAEKPGSRPG